MLLTPSISLSFNTIPVSATCVIVTSPSAPKAITDASDNNLTSSPATTSFATDKPPSVCSEPSVVLVASVVSSVINLPLTVSNPAELKLIFSDAASEAPV